MTILPANGLQEHMWARDRHGKMVCVQYNEVTKEFLHLAHQLTCVDLGQVLKPEVLDAVCKDCVPKKRILLCSILCSSRRCARH